MIRHINDYGIIILADERFSKKKNDLPQWVRKSFPSNNYSYNDVAKRMESFCKENKLALGKKMKD